MLLARLFREQLVGLDKQLLLGNKGLLELAHSLNERLMIAQHVGNLLLLFDHQQLREHRHERLAGGLVLFCLERVGCVSIRFLYMLANWHGNWQGNWLDNCRLNRLLEHRDDVGNVDLFGFERATL